jgi:hypothetical protein
MKKVLIVLITILTGFNWSYCQTHTINIPELKNINPGDHYPSASLPATYTEKFEILISLYVHSNWIRLGRKELVFAHKADGWYKMQIDADAIYGDTSYYTEIKTIKLNNNSVDCIWNVFKENHLFDMKDERSIKIPSCSVRIHDGAEYEFEIYVGKKYKKLYFYEPEFYEEKCPGVSERKQIVNCIKAFEKYLGSN